MHRDPELDAKITEEAGLTAEPNAVPSVTNPDAPGEEGIDAAEAKQVELDRNAEAAAARTTGPTVPADRAPSLDRLDKERAAAGGMPPPSNR